MWVTVGFWLPVNQVGLQFRGTKKWLNSIEREILIALILDRLALLDGYISDCADMLGLLGLTGGKVMNALRCMSEEGRLHRLGLIEYENPEEDLRDRKMVVDPGLVEAVLMEAGGTSIGWSVKNENELHRHMAGLTRALCKQNEDRDHQTACTQQGQ